jgi:hypothetical protein
MRRLSVAALYGSPRCTPAVVCTCTEQPAPTGIDYLALVAAAHDEAAGTGAKIDFTQLAMFTAEGQDRP